MKIEKLLFVTKFEQLWFDALQSLLELRKTGLNHVVFLNVIERDKVALRRGTGYRKKEEVKLREIANIRFIDWAESLFEQGMEVGAYIVVGSLVQQVILAVEKEDVDLIVIGRPKKGKLEQFYSGSDVTEIIRRSRTPVLVYKYLHPDGMQTEKPFEKPLLALDWSSASLKAVQFLKELKGIASEINAVHIIDESRLKGDSSMSVQKSRKDSRQKLEKICDEFEKEGIRAKPHVYVGNAILEIEKAARECQATMVVAGTSGKGSLKERLIGNIPEALARDSVFPILLIPPET
ncbi:MAG: universal stress protein family protein [Deltaproteobacteria bacterium RBG_13_49_15]|nr:MAG: universal stress protein family protein [Deltaproteobacteria bacterium RBG_13_49_15]